MALRPNQNRGPKREEEPYRINNLIKGVTKVRMVGENVEQGIVDFKVSLFHQKLYLLFAVSLTMLSLNTSKRKNKKKLKPMLLKQ